MEVLNADLARLSPLVHRNIKFLGQYSFALSDTVARDQLRPLRMWHFLSLVFCEIHILNSYHRYRRKRIILCHTTKTLFEYFDCNQRSMNSVIIYEAIFCKSNVLHLVYYLQTTSVFIFLAFVHFAIGIVCRWFVLTLAIFVTLAKNTNPKKTVLLFPRFQTKRCNKKKA